MRESLYNIIDPNNKDTWESRLYNHIMIVAIVMGMLPLAFREHTMLLFVIDKISCAFFILDYIIRWRFANRTGKCGKWSFLLYPFRPMAIIDLLSILPSLTILNSTFKLFRITRLLRILRLARMVRYYEPLRIMIAVIRKEFGTLMTVLVFACFYIIITALIMFNVEDGIDATTGEPVFSNFFEAIYWATCTLTTVGYGDIYPVTNLARFFCMLSSLVGVAVIALPSGVITAGYIEELKRNNEMKKKMIKERKRKNNSASTKNEYSYSYDDDMIEMD